jgi:hypothetical protein
MDDRDSRNELGERICHELQRIANALESLIPSAETVPEPPACPHPMEARIDFGTTEGRSDWQCSICQFRPPLEP